MLHSASLSPSSICSYVLLHVALIPPTHARRLLSLFIYTLWTCAEPLSLFLSQLSYRSEDFHRPALRAGGRPALLRESAQDLTQSTSLDVPSKKPLRLRFVSGFPPTDPYHSYSLIISFRLFPYLYLFFLHWTSLRCSSQHLFHLLRLEPTFFYPPASSCGRHH